MPEMPLRVAVVRPLPGVPAANRAASAFGLMNCAVSLPSSPANCSSGPWRCISAHPLDIGHALVKLEATVSVATIMPGDTVEEVLRRAARNRERVKEF